MAARHHQPKRYPPGHIKRAIALYAAGATLLHIGSRTGADAKTIRRWVKEAGQPMRRPGRPRIYDSAQLIDAHESLGSYAAVGRMVGCSSVTVMRARRASR